MEGSLVIKKKKVLFDLLLDLHCEGPFILQILVYVHMTIKSSLSYDSKLVFGLVQIREDIKKGVHVENLTELEVTSARDVIQQLVQVFKPFFESGFVSYISCLVLEVYMF